MSVRLATFLSLALVTWTETFLSLIQARPGDFGLSAIDATNYATSRSRFVDLYLQAQGDATRTRVVIIALLSN